MLNFLENHDEQRIASDYFIADGMKAIPALIVSSCISTQPFMLYSGQELGERGMDAEGFSGKDGRTSIFDYWSVKTLREWNNNGKFDGALLSCESQKLRKIYQNILTLLNQEKALSKGLFFDLMYVNYDNAYFCTTTTYAFIRSYQEEHILIVVNFSERDIEQHINIPQHAFDFLKIKEDNYNAIDLLSGTDVMLKITPNVPCAVHVPAYSGVMLKFNVSQIQG
jgi:glycosidase